MAANATDMQRKSQRKAKKGSSEEPQKNLASNIIKVKYGRFNKAEF